MSAVCPKCLVSFSSPHHLPFILPTCPHYLCSSCVTTLKQKQEGRGKVQCFVTECEVLVIEEDERFLVPDYHLIGYLATMQGSQIIEKEYMPDSIIQFVKSTTSYSSNLACVKSNDNKFQASSDLQSWYPYSMNKLETHVIKCHRLLELVEVKAVEEFKVAQEIRRQGLIKARDELEDMMTKLQQLLDAAERENVDDGSNNYNLVKVIYDIGKFSSRDFASDIAEESVAVKIDRSIFESISNHISVQEMKYEPMIQESLPTDGLVLKQSLSELGLELECGVIEAAGSDSFAGTEDVVLLHVQSPESFYVMRTKDLQLLNWLRGAIQKEVNEGEVQGVKINDIAAVTGLSSIEYQRVQIVTIESNLAWVYFLDHGNTMQVPLSTLVGLSPKVSTLPPLAQYCSLSGVVGELEWDEDVGKGVKRFFGKDVAKATVLGKEGKTNNVVVTKSEDKADVSLLEFLVFRGLACKINSESESIQPSYFRQYQSLPLATTAAHYLVKVVNVISPCQMFVNLVGEDLSYLKFMDNLIDEMQEHYKEDVEDQMILVPYIGMVCAIQHNERFFRGEVLEVLDDMVRVKLVDVGLTQIVQFSKLRRIPDEFMYLPEMAIRVALAGVQEIQGPLLDISLGKIMRMELQGIMQEEYIVAMHEIQPVHSSTESVNKIVLQKAHSKTEPCEEEMANFNMFEADDTKDALEIGRTMVVGTMCSCHVVSAKSPDNICLRRLEDEECFREFHTELNTVAGKLPHVDLAWQEGDSCLVKTSTHGWGRARLDRMKEDRMVELWLYDFGSKIVSEIGTLRSLPSRFSDRSPYSWSVQLSCLRPTGGLKTWASTTCEALKDILEKAGMEVSVELGQRIDMNFWQAELFVKEKDGDSGPLDPDQTRYKSVRESLVELGLALPTVHDGGDVGAVVQKDNMVNVDELAGSTIVADQSRDPNYCWDCPRLPSKDRFVGYVSHVDWDCNLYLSSMEDNFDNLRTIGSVLNDKYEGSTPSPHDLRWSVGEACVAQFSLDKKWYRGKVLEVRDMEYLVKFVDYGSEELCKPKNLRKELFMTNIPVQCFTAQLEITPITSKWEKGVLDFIHMTVIDKPMNVTVVKNKDGFPLTVKLVTLAGLDMTDLLVNNGYARLGSDVVKV